MQSKEFDVVIVGAGILGLACALAAHKKGLSVAVIEQQSRCVAASVRNFGFVTVSGQRSGKHWQRAKYSSDVWADIAPKAGIDVVQTGLYMPAQRPEALAVAEAFLQTEMGAGCRFLSESEIKSKLPYLSDCEGVMYSPHELRVESKVAIEQLARWLESQGIQFFRQTKVLGIDLPNIDTSLGKLKAQRCIVCPGIEAEQLYPQAMIESDVKHCTLQMLRVKPKQATSLPGALMSDLSFARYDGFAQLPEGQVLSDLIKKQQPEYIENGIHLIVVQSADGSWVIGDSHHYDSAELPFRNERIDELILSELASLMPTVGVSVQERWLGVYSSASDVVHKSSPQSGVALGVVTSGSGASTSFAFAEELLDYVMQS